LTCAWNKFEKLCVLKPTLTQCPCWMFRLCRGRQPTARGPDPPRQAKSPGPQPL